MKILVLDDDPARHKILSARWSAHELVQVWNYEEAVLALDLHGHFDLCLRDHDLGGTFIYKDGIEMTGMDVVRHIVRRFEQGLAIPDRAIVHTWNTPRAPLMVSALNEVGCYARYEPFSNRGSNTNIDPAKAVSDVAKK